MNIKINEIKMTPPTAFTPGQVIEEQEVISPSMLALQELQETTGAALYETMEEIGMALSGKLRESYKFTDAEKLERRQQALLRLIKQIQEDNGATLRPLTEENSDPDLQNAYQIIALAMALTAGGLSKRKNAICNRNWIRLQRRRDGNLPFLVYWNLAKWIPLRCPR